MTVEIATIQRLRVFAEAAGASTFGIDASASIASFLDVPTKEGSIKRGDIPQRLLDPKLAGQFLDYHDEKLLGSRAGGKLAFTMPLHSHGLTMNGAETQPSVSTWGQLLMLKTMFGATTSVAAGGARTVQAGSTTSVVNVTVGRGGDFTPGDVIACRVGSAATAIECREVLSVAVDAVTVVEQFSATPITGAAALGSVNVHLTEDPDTSLQFALEGAEADDRLLIMGCNGAPKLDIKIDEIPELSLDLMCADMVRLASGTLAAASYAFYSPFVSAFCELHWTTVSGSTVARNVVDQASQSIDLGITYGPVKTGGGVNNVLRWRRQRGNPVVKGNFVTLWQDTTYESERANKTDKRLDLQLGNIPGSTIMISVRTVQVVADPEAAHESGIGGQTVTWEGRIPTAGTNAETRSAITLHFV